MTTKTTAPANYRYLGTTDECIECQQCGKADLKATVVLAILDADGNEEEVTYYGSTCAARALAIKGNGRAVLQSARFAHHDTLTAAADARRMLTHYGLPEIGEPGPEELREAMRRYVQQHRNIHEIVAETGIGVRARVLDMLIRKQADLATATLVDPVCSYCRMTH